MLTKVLKVFIIKYCSTFSGNIYAQIRELSLFMSTFKAVIKVIYLHSLEFLMFGYLIISKVATYRN